jgi:hypothetical protein
MKLCSPYDDPEGVGWAQLFVPTGPVADFRRAVLAIKSACFPSLVVRWSITALLVVLLHVGQVVADVSPGYTLHFNFVMTEQAAGESIDAAAQAQAEVLNIVPPAHIWRDTRKRHALDASIAGAKRRGIGIILSRMDAVQSGGDDWLYAHALKTPGRLPDSSPTEEWFCATVGNHRFERWQREETRYYAEHYGRVSHLVAVAVGGMVEPFVSQRGSLLQWSESTDSYEIAQYTREGLTEWHRWLREHFSGIDTVNRLYGTRFSSISKVPMVRNGGDQRFGSSREAYFDFVQSMNDWFLRQYFKNRQIWRRGSVRPFLLQLSGFVSEKIAKGRPEFAAFDLPAWIEQADGVAMSLYTNTGFEDCGHAADMGTLQLLAATGESGKPTFIAESGAEMPRVELNPHEMSFVTRAGMLINPMCYVYEYFRYSRDGNVDPGMMVTPWGSIHQPAFDVVSGAMHELKSLGRGRSTPCFYYLSAPLTARGSELAGRVNRAVYQLAGYLPCRLLPWRSYGKVVPGAVVLLPPGIHGVAPDSELVSLLKFAEKSGWHIVSDATTREGLLRLHEKAVVHSVALDRLLSRSYADDEAMDLFDELNSVEEFQLRVSEQPVEPRPGLSWLQIGRDLYLWVDDSEPVRCRRDALRNGSMDRLWCSTRNGKPARVVLVGSSGDEQRKRVPCRQWLEVDRL